jgi:integrase
LKEEKDNLPRRSTPLLSEAAKEYLEVRETYLARNTFINERIQLRLFIAGVGDRRCHLLTARQTEQWFALEATRQKASSYNKIRSRVAGFIKFAMLRGWMDTDPAGMVRPRKVVKEERFRLSVPELLELPSYARSERDRAIIVTACTTALRADEIRNLRVRDVDLAGGWLRVMISKSSKQDVMPVTQELAVELREWLKAYERMTRTDLEPEWYLFPARVRGNGSGVYRVDGTARINKMASVIQEAIKAAGHVIDSGEGVHTLRRSVARAFFDMACVAGYDAALRMTSSLLHHSSSQVTEIYLGLQSERLSRDDFLRDQPFLTACRRPRETARRRPRSCPLADMKVAR